MDVDNVSFWVFLAGLFYRRNRTFGEEDQVFRIFCAWFGVSIAL
jgi:hypothetical protein